MKKFLKTVFWVIFVALLLDRWGLVDVDGIVSDLLGAKDRAEPTAVVTTQPTQPQVVEIQDPSRPGYNMGHCATLTEDAHVVVFFLDDAESRWTGPEAEQFMQTVVEPGLVYIEQQALSYGVAVSLDATGIYTNENRSISFAGVFGTYFTRDDQGQIVVGAELTPEERGVLSSTARQLGFASYEELYDQLQRETGCSQIGFLFVPHKAGASYGMYDRSVNNYIGYEYGVVYANNEHGEPADQWTVVRRILGMFGGGFSGESVDGRESTLSVAGRMYHYSVMFKGGNEQDCIVDPYTAYSVGWRQTLPPENAGQDPYGGISQPGDTYRPKYDKGTCRELSGNILLLTIFLDDDETAWTQDAIDRAYQKQINPAIDYLTNQAKKRNFSLQIDTGYYATDISRGRYVRYGGIISPDAYTMTNDDMLHQAALSLGFESMQSLHDKVLEGSGAQQLVIMVALNKKGRSFAVPDTDDNGNDNVEYFVLYRDHWTSNKASYPATVAHELLHLFGAEDLYQEPNSDRRAGRAAICKKYYPNDIMYRELQNIGKNQINDYTAYAIGWSNVRPDTCTVDTWWDKTE